MDFLNSILNHIDEALLVTDRDGKILYFNEVAATMCSTLFGKSLRADMDILDIRTSDDSERVHDAVITVQMEKRAEATFAEYAVNGTTKYLESSYVPVMKASQLTHICIFTRDVTPQKVFEKKLTTQAVSIGNIFDRANAIIIGVDTLGYITDWNDYCAQVTGFEKEEVFSEKFTDILLPGKEQAFDELLTRVMNQQSVSNHEITVQTKSGKSIFLLSGTHRISPTGVITGVVFVGQDVTELSRYRESLERQVAERTRELQAALQKEKEVVEMKSRFISIASHEFRTPLASIEVAARFIRKKKPTSKNVLHEKLSAIEQQVKHMTYLLDDVLTYGKSEAGKIQLQVSVIELRPFIDRMLEDIGNVTRNTHRVLCVIDKVPQQISTDEKLLRNILINLLTNAIKFSPGKQTVRLEIRGIDDRLHLVVRDQGMGIPKEERERIFEAFIRGTRASAIQGTGLGLSIVRKAVELLGGTIEMESQLGIGTTFTVNIPLQ